MTDSPMREAWATIESARGPHQCCEYNLDDARDAISRMDNRAGQVAAAMRTNVRVGAVTVGSPLRDGAVANRSYDQAEALERERTKRMKGEGDAE